LGIFGIFKGVKGSPDEKNGKIYSLKILYTHQAKQIFFSENFPLVHSLAKNSKSRKRSEKGQSCHFQIIVVFTRSSE
jgi:hypothetical protein